MTTTTRHLDVGEGRLAYDVTGPADGPLVICAPGMGDVRGMYRFFAPLLAEAGYRVTTVDIRGHGETSTGWTDHSSAAIGGDLLALVDHLGGPAILIGDSYTAASSVWAAATAADKVRAVVLAGAFVRTHEPAGVVAKLATSLVARSVALWTMYYKSIYKSGRPADLGSYADALRANLRQPERAAAFRAMFVAGHDASEARLPDVECPSLILMGTADPDFPDATAEAHWIAEHIGGTPTVRLLAGVGHYPPAEQPDVSAAAVLEFLATV